MDATGQAQPQDSSGRHLLLPVPVGAARFGVPKLYLFWVLFFFFFWTEREPRTDLLGKRQDTKPRKRQQPPALVHQAIRLYMSHYGDSGQVAPVKPTHSRTLVTACRGDRTPLAIPGLCSCVGSPQQSPSVTSGLGPAQTRTSHALWSLCICLLPLQGRLKHECLVATIT